LSRWDEAIIEFDEYIRLRPEDVSGYSGKGQALYGKQAYREATETLRAGLAKAKRGNIDFARRWLVFALAQDSKDQEALDQLTEIESKSQLDVELRRVKARVLIGVGKHLEALAIVEPIVRDEPKSADAWYQQGRALHSLRRHGEAIESLRRYLTLEPRTSTSPFTHVFIAEAHYREGRVDEARAALRKAFNTGGAEEAVMDEIFRVVGAHGDAAFFRDELGGLAHSGLLKGVGGIAEGLGALIRMIPLPPKPAE
jgi:tetratricopeptide (TPR) repeat protein